MTSKLSLRTMLIFLFVIQVILAVGLTGYFSFYNGQKAVDDLALQLRSEVTAHIHEKLQNYIKTPHLVNELNADAIHLELLNLNDRRSIEWYLWEQVQNFKTVSYIAIATEQPDYIGIRIDEDGITKIDLLESTATSYRLVGWETDKFGNRVKKVPSSDPDKTYDPRSRNWYKIAKDAQEKVWTQPFTYAYGEEKNIAISANQPIYNAQGRFVGVTSTDLILTDVTEFLKHMTIGKTGQAFILDRNDILIASSHAKQNGIVKASTHPDLLIHSITTFLTKHFGSLNDIKGNQYLNFNIAGEKHYLQITSLQDEYGLDWLVVVAIPEMDFMANIHENTRYTFILMAIALFIAMIIGFWMAGTIIRPILMLKKAAKKVESGRFKFTQKLPVDRTDEIGELAQSFESMAIQLKASFDTLEQKVEERTKELSIAYKRLKASQAQLIQSEKMASLGQMIAGVAHEINTPLGYVKNNVEMIEEMIEPTEELIKECDKLCSLLTHESTNPQSLQNQITTMIELSEAYCDNEVIKDMKEVSKDAIHGLDEISELVVNLKDFARLDQAKIANVNINENLNSVLVIAQNMIKNKATIKKDYANLPLVKCAPSQINQVFLNIISNAVQAIEKKGTIALKTRTDEHHVYVTIQDTGKGIEKTVLPKIFDPFFTTKPVGYGTGLGLSISYQIIRQHGGTIKVASEVGKGTKMIVVLPHQPATTEGKTS